MPAASLADAIRRSGLVSEGDRGVVLVSGGADSVGLLAGLSEVLGADRLVALHVNYGLRREATGDEALVRDLCARLGVECETVRAGEREGNLQAWAREIRHRKAEALRSSRGLDWIAVGHTRTDQAETLIYRLAASPGVRPLLAMPPRSGHLIRPLLDLTRSELRAAVLEAGIPFNDDATNADPAFARNRIRNEVLPVLREINPAVELNIGRTRAELEEDEELLLRLAGEVLETPLPAEILVGAHPARGRRILRLLAERELGRPVPVTSGLLAEAARLCDRPEGGELDLGGGARLVVESGLVRVSGDDGTAAPDPTPLLPTGDSVAFGWWRISSEELGADAARARFGDPLTACFDEERLLAALGGGSLTIRGRRPGDRISPLGMEGTKALQDLFVESRIPRSERDSRPVVVAGETVAWVPGLALSGNFALDEGTRTAIALHAAAGEPDARTHAPTDAK